MGKVERFCLFIAPDEHECVRPVGFDPEVNRKKRVGVIGDGQRIRVVFADMANHITPLSATAVCSLGLLSLFVSSASTFAASVYLKAHHICNSTVISLVPPRR